MTATASSTNSLHTLALRCLWLAIASGTLFGSSAPAQSDGPDAGNGGLEAAAIVAAIEANLVGVIERCERSVVAISRVSIDQVARAQLDVLRPGSSLQLTEDPTSEDFVPSFFGSGVIVSHDGFIVTCAHVLDDPAKHRYYVWLDHRCYPASVAAIAATPLAADPFSDLAVIKIEAEHLPTIPFADQPVQKGQFVLALGNPYAIARDGEANASWGIVSNTNRFAPKESDTAQTENLHQLGTLICTDLRMAVGSSGGALVNMRGQLVGLTTSLIAQRGYEQSAGLAIAADSFFQQTVTTLKLGKQPEYGFLGIQPENLRAVEREQGLSGARVGLVIPGLPGSTAGLREGDVISQVDEVAIGNRNDLFRELSKVPTGRKTKLVVQRQRGQTAPQILTIEAELTKKYLATNRPAFSINGPPTWRGAQVEYQSAIAGELERIAIVRGGTRVAFLNVTPDSPVWRAGIRAGYGIVSVDSEPIESPDQFHAAVARNSGKVALVIIGPDSKQQQIVVDPAVTE